jgi:hypothetical protein
MQPEPEIYRRQNVEEAEEALRRMEVPPQGDFAGFYRRYSGSFSSRRTGFELLDIREGGESSIEGVTRICRERFGLPSHYLVLTEPL